MDYQLEPQYVDHHDGGQGGIDKNQAHLMLASLSKGAISGDSCPSDLELDGDFSVEFQMSLPESGRYIDRPDYIERDSITTNLTGKSPGDHILCAYVIRTGKEVSPQGEVSDVISSVARSKPVPVTTRGSGSSDACTKAKSRLKKARAKLKRARKKGAGQAKINRLKTKVRKAKKKRKEAC